MRLLYATTLLLSLAAASPSRGVDPIPPPTPVVPKVDPAPKPDPKPPAPPVPVDPLGIVINVPVSPTPPPPPPPPVDPAALLRLLPGQQYVVDSNVPIEVIAFPETAVSLKSQIVKAGSSTTIYGNFPDTPGVDSKVFGSPTADTYLTVVTTTATVNTKVILHLIPTAPGAVRKHWKRDVINVGPAGPPPPPPPPPVPPVPPVPVGENPFGASPGIRVMIVYDDKAITPKEQDKIIRGATARDFFESKVGSGRYCIVGKSEVFSDEADMKPFATAFAKSDRKSLPWIYVGKESTGTSEALPATVDATIALISKYIGG